MGLNILDFLSNPPNNFIFQKTSHKTNFGGVLTLIYIILVLAIIIYYWFDYESKDMYTIEYSKYKALFFDENTSNIYDKERLDSYFDFKFTYVFQYKNDDNYYGFDGIEDLDFILINVTNNQTIPRETTLNISLTDVKIGIMLDASKYDVNLIRSDISFYLWIDFHGYDIDHQNEIIPLRRNIKEFQRLEYDISPKNLTIKFYKWKLVKYKADEGLAKL